MGLRRTLLGTAILPLVALACSPQQNAEAPVADVQQEQVHEVSGLPLLTVTVETDEGSHSFVSELAQSREAQAKGLMFRTELGPNEGMLFPSEQATARVFHMKNTPIPLDIIFVGMDGRISNIAQMAEPYSEAQIFSVGSAIAVFEIPGGRAAELGIEPGDTVSW